MFCLISFTGMVLGQGAFGKVVKAEAIGIDDAYGSTTVAVKTVRGKSSYLLVANLANTK